MRIFSPAKLTAALDGRGISQRDLARKLGVHESTISKLISGTQRPSRKRQADIANAIGCAIEDLWTYSADSLDMVDIPTDLREAMKALSQMDPAVRAYTISYVSNLARLYPLK
jgi:transcriptional regulator with XRE-family HTH domain